MDDAADGIRRGSVSGLDYVRIDIGGGRSLRVAQTSGHGAHIGAGGNHQGRIGVAQRMERGAFRQANFPGEGGKPAGEGRGVHRCATPCRKQAVAFLPLIAQLEPLTGLPGAILLEQIMQEINKREAPVFNLNTGG